MQLHFLDAFFKSAIVRLHFSNVPTKRAKEQKCTKNVGIYNCTLKRAIPHFQSMRLPNLDVDNHKLGWGHCDRIHGMGPWISSTVFDTMYQVLSSPITAAF